MQMLGTSILSFDHLWLLGSQTLMKMSQKGALTAINYDCPNIYTLQSHYSMGSAIMSSSSPAAASPVLSASASLPPTPSLLFLP